MYGLGVCAASCGASFAEMVPGALEKLAAVIQHPQARDEDNEAASDNAVGLRCRALPAARKLNAGVYAGERGGEDLPALQCPSGLGQHPSDVVRTLALRWCDRGWELTPELAQAGIPATKG